ncbi:hypothetical protein EDD11_000283 [Mortierella claussenii]|nr:hypothetical protein EDD11_000283 [Mortierella claussenii]
MKFVYTALVSCIALSALAAAAEEKCVACTEQPNIVVGGIQGSCGRAGGKPYKCNFLGYNCKFCLLPNKSAITQEMTSWCDSNDVRNSDGTIKDDFGIDTWSLTKCT